MDFQHHLAVSERQDLIWGVGYRRTSTQTVGTIEQAYSPANFSVQIFNAFLQDEITLRRNLVLTLGAKIEH